MRDWGVATNDEVLFSYSGTEARPLDETPAMARWIWSSRTVLGNRATFAKSTYFEEGRPWWAWHQVGMRRIATPLTITFPLVATHNHFVLDRGGKVFNRHAQVIKLPAESSESDYLGLLGLLNSSLACFWLKQVSFNKGDSTDSKGARTTGDSAFDTYEFASTKVAEFPVCAARPLGIATQLDSLARQLSAAQPASVLAASPPPSRAMLDTARARAAMLRREQLAVQEELDWHCYRLYGLLPAGTGAADFEYEALRAPVELNLGERAFEIVLARRLAAGVQHSTWFERNGSKPVTDIPAHWPEDYRRVVARRIDLIEHDKSIGLIERPEFKRRWNSPRWQDLEQAALQDWLLARLESKALWVASTDQPPQINTTSRLADKVQRDAEFMQVAGLYAGHADFDVAQLVAGLVTAESVPFLPALRYSDTGLRKRAQWEDTWALQRREDKGESVGTIPVPPKYKKEDFLKVAFWDLRGGLDVPKERWVSYPGCERGADTSLPIAWAGWDHLQQATALAAYYLEMKESEGWDAARLQPLLAGLLELVPWLEQWHNEVDPVYGERMGAYYKGFVSEEARAHGFTLDDLRAWKPAAGPVRRGRRRAT